MYIDLSTILMAVDYVTDVKKLNKENLIFW